MVNCTNNQLYAKPRPKTEPPHLTVFLAVIERVQGEFRCGDSAKWYAPISVSFSSPPLISGRLQRQASSLAQHSKTVSFYLGGWVGKK